MRIKSFTRAVMVSVIAMSAVVFSFGCDINLVNYLSRNACEFLNCDVMFFIEDVLPLSGGPEAGGSMPAMEEEGGH